MNLSEIRRLVKLVEASGIDELEIEEEGTRIRVVKNSTSPDSVQHVVAVPGTQPYPVQQSAPVTPQVESQAQSALPVTETVSDTSVAIDSPMVGTFYRAPSPEAPAYVQVGDQVKIGQVLCIIEAMKLMNEIEAEVSGKISKIHVENAQAVEFGQPLFSIEPD